LITWPSKTELYDSNKFDDKLVVYLAIQPFFNRKQMKTKLSTEEITKALKEDYGFQHLDKFKSKPGLLDVIYKIIVGDRIRFIFN
jgi:hypothetical protein